MSIKRYKFKFPLKKVVNLMIGLINAIKPILRKIYYRSILRPLGSEHTKTAQKVSKKWGSLQPPVATLGDHFKESLLQISIKYSTLSSAAKKDKNKV